MKQFLSICNLNKIVFCSLLGFLYPIIHKAAEPIQRLVQMICEILCFHS